MAQNARPIATVLIPAAGEGSRLGGVRKQYRDLGGAPLLIRTLEVFDRHPLVDHIVVSAPAEDAADLASSIRVHGIRKLHSVVAGGETRQASVGRALDAAPGASDLILVHDAVRPFVGPEDISAVIEQADRHGSAALAVAVSDTLRAVEAGSFGKTIDRTGLFRMQTPQAFRRDWFVEAHARAGDLGYEGTDDVALVQRLGREVAFVSGSTLNFKVTTAADWNLALALWQARTEAEGRAI